MLVPTKKWIFILVLLTLTACSCNRRSDVTQFHINGKVDKLKDGKVYLSQNLVNLDSAEIRDGRFSLKASVWNHSFVELVFHGKEAKDKKAKNRGWLHPITVFAEKGASYKFFATDSSDIFNHTYSLETNSASQRQFYKYDIELHRRNRQFKRRLAHYEEMMERALTSGEQPLRKAYSDSVDHYHRKRADLTSDMQKETIANEPNSFLSVYLLSKSLAIENDLEFYVDMEKRLVGEFRQHVYAQRFIKRLSKYRNDIPIKLNLGATDESGKPFDISKFEQDRLVVLDFWATWCAPCLETMPSALEAKTLLANKKVAYLFLSYDTRPKTWMRQSRKLGLQDSYLINESNKPYLDQTLNMATIPRYVVMDRKGNVLLKKVPGPNTKEFFELIDDLLSKINSSSLSK